MLMPVSCATWPILAEWLTVFVPMSRVQSGVSSRVKWLFRALVVSTARIEEILSDFAAQLDVVSPSELLRNPKKIPEVREHARARRCKLTTDRIGT